METDQIILINCGNFDSDFLIKVANEIAIEYNLPITLFNANIELVSFYDQDRRQYDANKLLKKINDFSFPENAKKLAMFNVDLFIPILTFIFGQATFNGDTAVASIYRLKNEQYGMAQDKNLDYFRFKKVIIHEIGHMFGLIHCHFPNCVMRSSTYVEDIDQKQQHFCAQCQGELAVILNKSVY